MSLVLILKLCRKSKDKTGQQASSVIMSEPGSSEPEAQERFNKLMATVFKCTEVLERLMIKRIEELTPAGRTPSPWTLDDYLRSKKSDILATPIGKNKKFTFFPPPPLPTKLAEWDISMLCCILSILFETHSSERGDIESLRRIRNTLCHTRDTVLSLRDYNHYKAVVMTVLDHLLEYIDDEALKEDVTGAIERIDQGSVATIDRDEMMRFIHFWYGFEREMEERLDRLDSGRRSFLIHVSCSLLVMV